MERERKVDLEEGYLRSVTVWFHPLRSLCAAYKTLPFPFSPSEHQHHGILSLLRCGADYPPHHYTLHYQSVTQSVSGRCYASLRSENFHSARQQVNGMLSRRFFFPRLHARPPMYAYRSMQFNANQRNLIRRGATWIASISQSELISRFPSPSA